MKFLVTGATGYIGQHLVRMALRRGHTVVAASRKPVVSAAEWLPFDLSSDTAVKVPVGIDAVFHLAAITTTTDPVPGIELRGAKRVIAAAAARNARMIFLSSQTASESAPTPYGRTKWEIEREVLAARGVVVRAGQVYGGTERGLFGTLTRAIRSAPVIPAFLPAPHVQPVHVDDLADALIRSAENGIAQSSIFRIGSPTPVSFNYFLGVIARVRSPRCRLTVPVPVIFIRLVSAFLGPRMAARLGVRRLISLFDLPRMETASDLQALGITLRPLASGMARSGSDRRRRLIREGTAFLTYVMKTRPTSTLVRRYVRCVENSRSPVALNLPAITLRLPITLALLDNPQSLSRYPDSELAWRLNAALVIAEASIQGAHRFLGVGTRPGIITGTTRIVFALSAELLWRMLSPFARLLSGSFRRMHDVSK